jgi:hypothetical protein
LVRQSLVFDTWFYLLSLATCLHYLLFTHLRASQLLCQLHSIAFLLSGKITWPLLCWCWLLAISWCFYFTTIF